MAPLAATWLHPDRSRGPALDDLAPPAVIDPAGTVASSTALSPTELSSTDLAGAAARLAGSLAQLGVERGDAVAWPAANRWETVALYRACWRLGAVAVPLHHQAGPAEVDAIVARLQPAAVIDPDDVGRLIEVGEPVGPSRGRPDDLAVVLHTSGSSGEPKGVLHTQAGLAAKAEVMTEVHGLGPDDTSPDARAHGPHLGAGQRDHGAGGGRHDGGAHGPVGPRRTPSTSSRRTA